MAELNAMLLAAKSGGTARLPEGRPVWTAVSESFNPASSSEVVEDLIRVIGRRLRSEGLLPGP